LKFANAEAGEETGRQKQGPVPGEAKEESVLHGKHCVVHMLSLPQS
jgi:hypothetical protein